MYLGTNTQMQKMLQLEKYLNMLKALTVYKKAVIILRQQNVKNVKSIVY